jgi:hypothetical protein
MKPGQHDQIHLRLPQGRHISLLGVFLQLGAEFSRRDEAGGELALPGVLQNSRALDVAQHDADLRRHATGRNRFGHGHEVRALAGTEHAQSKWFQFAHAAAVGLVVAFPNPMA